MDEDEQEEDLRRKSKRLKREKMRKKHLSKKAPREAKEAKTEEVNDDKAGDDKNASDNKDPPVPVAGDNKGPFAPSSFAPDLLAPGPFASGLPAPGPPAPGFPVPGPLIPITTSPGPLTPSPLIPGFGTPSFTLTTDAFVLARLPLFFARLSTPSFPILDTPDSATTARLFLFFFPARHTTSPFSMQVVRSTLLLLDDDYAIQRPIS